MDAARFARARPPRVIQEPIVPLTEQEIARIFAVLSTKTFRGARLRAIVATLLDTGIRAGELKGLRLADLDLEAGVIVVRPATDKTRKGRTIALGRRAKLELTRYLLRFRGGEPYDQADDAPLFIMENGLAYKDRTFKHLIARLGQRARVGHLHPHRFRHTFAILSLRGGMDPFVLMHTLGHKDMAMTKRYLNFVNADVREQKRASSPLDRLKL